MIEVGQCVDDDVPWMLKHTVSGIEQQDKRVIRKIATTNILTEIRNEGCHFMGKPQPPLVVLSNDHIVDLQ